MLQGRQPSEGKERPDPGAEHHPSLRQILFHKALEAERPGATPVPGEGGREEGQACRHHPGHRARASTEMDAQDTAQLRPVWCAGQRRLGGEGALHHEELQGRPAGYRGLKLPGWAEAEVPLTWLRPRGEAPDSARTGPAPRLCAGPPKARHGRGQQGRCQGGHQGPLPGQFEECWQGSRQE